jgi:hypothetical protein
MSIHGCEKGGTKIKTKFMKYFAKANVTTQNFILKINK